MHDIGNKNAEESIVAKMCDVAQNLDNNYLIRVKDIQIEFIVKSLLNKKNELQNCLVSTCLDICKSICLNTIMLDKQPFEKIKVNGVIVISNHLGLNKLTKITTGELICKVHNNPIDSDIDELPPLTNDDPFLFLFAPVIGTLFDLILGDSAYYSIITMDYPTPYSDIVRRAGGIIVELTGDCKYEKLMVEATRISGLIKKMRKTPVFIFFPEGGTSGKRNDGTPYTLGEFKSGYARLAYDLNIPILPVIVYLDHRSVVTSRVLEISYGYANYDVGFDRCRMQEALNEYAV